MSDKPKVVELQPLAFCQEHKQGVAKIRDEDGNTHIQPFRQLDPDFPHEGPTLNLTEKTADGWYRGTLSHRGPPKVTSEAYRRGWERIFGNKATEGEA